MLYPSNGSRYQANVVQTGMIEFQRGWRTDCGPLLVRSVANTRVVNKNSGASVFKDPVRNLSPVVTRPLGTAEGRVGVKRCVLLPVRYSSNRGRVFQTGMCDANADFKLLRSC